ncbi:MAG: hypothetical protein Q8N98_04060, partial [bacterium]|nr:hypothetical protein [bacterium]
RCADSSYTTPKLCAKTPTGRTLTLTVRQTKDGADNASAECTAATCRAVKNTTPVGECGGVSPACTQAYTLCDGGTGSHACSPCCVPAAAGQPTTLKAAQKSANCSSKTSLSWLAGSRNCGPGCNCADSFEYKVYTGTWDAVWTTAIFGTVGKTVTGLSGEEDLTTPATYHWKARQFNGYGASAWVAGPDFTTTAPPAAPVGLSTGCQSTLTPTLTWTGMAEAADYWIQVSDEAHKKICDSADHDATGCEIGSFIGVPAGFPNGWLNGTTPSYTVQTGILTDGQPYYFIVRIANSCGNEGAWSAVSGFSVNVVGCAAPGECRRQVPDIPTNLLPDNTCLGIFPTNLSWTAGLNKCTGCPESECTTPRFFGRIYKDSDAPPAFADWGTTGSYPLSIVPVDGSVYTWKIFQSNGGYTSATTSAVFTYKLPKPAKPAASCRNTSTVTWAWDIVNPTNCSAITDFKLEVSESPATNPATGNFTSTVFSSWLGSAAKTKDVAGSFAGKTLYAHVKAKNAAGTEGGWSQIGEKDMNTCDAVSPFIDCGSFNYSQDINKIYTTFINAIDYDSGIASPSAAYHLVSRNTDPCLDSGWLGAVFSGTENTGSISVAGLNFGPGGAGDTGICFKILDNVGNATVSCSAAFKYNWFEVKGGGDVFIASGFYNNVDSSYYENVGSPGRGKKWCDGKSILASGGMIVYNAAATGSNDCLIIPNYQSGISWQTPNSATFSTGVTPSTSLATAETFTPNQRLVFNTGLTVSSKTLITVSDTNIDPQTQVGIATILIKTGNLTINEDLEIKNQGNNKGPGVIFIVADGNIIIGPNVQKLDGVFITSNADQNKGKIIVEDSTRELKVNGMFYAQNGISLGRSAKSDKRPAETFTFQPQYLLYSGEIPGLSRRSIGIGVKEIVP